MLGESQLIVPKDSHAASLQGAVQSSSSLKKARIHQQQQFLQEVNTPGVWFYLQGEAATKKREVYVT
jgi:hypothetical protein